MDMPPTVPCEVKTTVTARGKLRHRCPYVDETDTGTIALTWRTSGATLELHALRRWLDGFTDIAVSHEALTKRIVHAVTSAPGVELVAIETHWLTADLAVTVGGC